MLDGSSITSSPRSIEGAASLGEVYRFLSIVFRQPLSATALDAIRSTEFLDALEAAGVDLDESFISLPNAELQDRLAVDYTQLFHGPRGHICPYESIRAADQNGELNGPFTSSVRAFFEDSGLAFDPSSDQLPDHIAVELEFMAELVRHEVASRRSGDPGSAERWQTIRRDFFVRHIGVWGSEFGQAVSGQAETDFYRELGLLLADILELDGVGLVTATSNQLKEEDHE